MATLSELGVLPLVALRRKNGSSYKEISEELRALFPGVRGLSVKSLKRFCNSHHLHATSRISDNALDILVACGIGMVRGTLKDV